MKRHEHYLLLAVDITTFFGVIHQPTADDFRGTKGLGDNNGPSDNT